MGGNRYVVSISRAHDPEHHLGSEHVFAAFDSNEKVSAIRKAVRDEIDEITAYGEVSQATVYDVLSEATAGAIPNEGWKKLSRLVEKAVAKRIEMNATLEAPAPLPEKIRTRADLIFQGSVREVDKRISEERAEKRRQQVAAGVRSVSNTVHAVAEDRDEKTASLVAARLDSLKEAFAFSRTPVKPYRDAISSELRAMVSAGFASTKGEIERHALAVGGHPSLAGLLASSSIKAAQAAADAERRLRLLEEEEPKGGARSWRDLEPSEFSEFPELSTKKAFDDNVVSAIAESSPGSPLSMIFVDVDDLKGLNTRFTNPRVNKGLAELARVIADAARGRGKAYRYGGDEFGLLLPNSTLDESASRADRICRAVRSLKIRDEPEMKLTVSCGVASLEDVSPRSAESLETAAAAASQAAKKGGKDRIDVWRPGM